MSNPQVDPNSAQYIFNQTGIPAAYTQNLENLGYLGNAFGGVQGSFQSEQMFQRLLKDIMDKQMQSFNFPGGPSVNALPYDMRSLFNASSPLLTDPLYGIEGASEMLSKGYAYGSLPNNPTRAWDLWQGQQQTPYSPMTQQQYPNYAPPAIGAFTAPVNQSPSGTFSGGNNAGNSTQGVGQSQTGTGPGWSSHIGSYTVPLMGGGQMTVNANSEAAARENASQGGGASADPNGQVITNRAAVG